MQTNHLSRNFLKILMLYCCLFFGQFIQAQNAKEFMPCNAYFLETTDLSSLHTYKDPRVFQAVYADYQNYIWDFGDGSPRDTGYIVSHIFPAAGKYVVSLIVYKSDTSNILHVCKDTTKQWITIQDSLIIPKPSLCSASLWYQSNGNTVTVTDQLAHNTLPSKEYFINWTMHWGDGNSAPGYISATHTYKNAGHYTVTVEKSVFKYPCYPDTLCKAMPIPVCHEKFALDVYTEKPNDSLYCHAQIGIEQHEKLVKFRNMANIDNIKNNYYEEAIWTFGDGNFMKNAGTPVTHYYEKPGQYFATLTKNTYYNPCPANPGGVACLALPYIVCTTFDSTYVTIEDSLNYLCMAHINYISNGMEVTVFDNTQSDGNTYYEWNFGDGTYGPYGTESKFNHTYQYPGMYTVTVKKSYITNVCPPGAYCIVPPTIHCNQTYKMDVYVNKIEKPICKAGLIFTLDGNRIAVKSKTSGYNINYMKLDYGDGDVTETNGNSINSRHTYHKNGMYELCLKIASAHDSLLPYIYMPEYCTDTYCLNFSVDADDNVTSLSESEESKIIVSTFPMPAKDKVQFNITNGKPDMTLRFYDAAGKFVKEISKVSGQNSEVEISDMTDGMYTYSLSNSDGVLNRGKITVMK